LLSLQDDTVEAGEDAATGVEHHPRIDTTMSTEKLLAAVLGL